MEKLAAQEHESGGEENKVKGEGEVVEVKVAAGEF